jgi:hypothetical protein
MTRRPVFNAFDYIDWEVEHSSILKFRKNLCR